MPDSIGPGRLRAVGPSEPAKPRRRGPGIAVIAVIVYGLAFVGMLWFFAGKARHPAPRPKAVSPATSLSTNRASLLAGTGLPPLAREEYVGRLVMDCCDCGCDLNLRRCLLSDRSCTRSPELAKDRLQRAASPPELAASAP